jgi:hypothetical protein
MRLDDRDGHDVEDTPNVCILRVRKLLVAPASIIDRLYILVHPLPIRTFEVESDLRDVPRR